MNNSSNNFTNTRIKELVAECTTIRKFSYDGYKGIEGEYNTEYFNKEKFAELIIKECCNICYDNNYMIGEDYVSLIYKHFGVLDE